MNRKIQKQHCESWVLRHPNYCDIVYGPCPTRWYRGFFFNSHIQSCKPCWTIFNKPPCRLCDKQQLKVNEIRFFRIYRPKLYKEKSECMYCLYTWLSKNYNVDHLFGYKITTSLFYFLTMSYLFLIYERPFLIAEY